MFRHTLKRSKAETEPDDANANAKAKTDAGILNGIMNWHQNTIGTMKYHIQLNNRHTISPIHDDIS